MNIQHIINELRCIYYSVRIGLSNDDKVIMLIIQTSKEHIDNGVVKRSVITKEVKLYKSNLKKLSKNEIINLINKSL